MNFFYIRTFAEDKLLETYSDKWVLLLPKLSLFYPVMMCLWVAFNGVPFLQGLSVRKVLVNYLIRQVLVYFKSLLKIIIIIKKKKISFELICFHFGANLNGNSAFYFNRNSSQALYPLRGIYYIRAGP
jgi:hypothetical protein